MSTHKELATEDYLSLINAAAETLKAKLQADSALNLALPRILIICGSGLGGIADILQKEPQLAVEYGEIPGFQQSTVAGHAGKLVFGLIGEKNVPVVAMVGRLHFYEGYTFQQTTFPVRVCKKLGVSTVVVTNAAGGANPEYKPADLMIINDHINLAGFAGHHPLRGPNLDEFGPRFQPLSDAYSHKLRHLFYTKAREIGVERPIHEGTYMYVAGPTFESRAEVRMARNLGADAIGMSSVPEVIVARHCGMDVLAMSLITNAGVAEKPAKAFEENPQPLDKGKASHEEVLQNAEEASKDVHRIFAATVNEM